MNDLPVIRQSERVDFKRCMKKWFWRWRKGLVPKQQEYGALLLGTWMHTALEQRYTSVRKLRLEVWFKATADLGLEEARARDIPDYQMQKAQDLRALGLGMAKGYDRKYGDDTDIRPIGAEIPLEYEIKNYRGEVVAIHRLKPDLLYRNPLNEIWLLENKTAKQISLEHLPIDDQARGYAAMSERALHASGWLRPDEHVKGVMYNYLRKIMPDERPRNELGQSLNKNGTVSKQQRTPEFVRHPVVLSRRAKQIAIQRLSNEAVGITNVTKELRAGKMDEEDLMVTPHKSCPKLCEFFAMCVVAEQGGNTKEMQRSMYIRRNPYEYEQDSADEPVSFDLA